MHWTSARDTKQDRGTHEERLLLERDVSPKSLDSKLEKKGTYCRAEGHALLKRKNRGVKEIGLERNRYTFLIREPL